MYLLNEGADGIRRIFDNIGKMVGDLVDGLVCELGDQIWITCSANQVHYSV